MRDRTLVPRKFSRRPLGLLLAAAFFSTGLFTFAPAASAGFAAPVQYGTGFSPQGVAVGDLNGDTFNDVAISDAASKNVAILINNGDGTFAEKVTYPTDSQPYSIAMADLTGDGFPDLVTPNSGDNNTISVLLNDGDGIFGLKQDYPVGTDPQGVAIGLLNGDGLQDIVVANPNSDNISVLLGGLFGSFAPATNYTVGDGPTSVSIGNLNTGTVSDLVVTLGNTNDVAVLLDDGFGGYDAPVFYSGGGSPNDSLLADLNGDGVLDLATSNSGTSNISVHPGTDDGTFGPQTSFVTPSAPNSIAEGDLDADGTPDLVTANISTDNVSVFRGVGNNTFGPRTEYPAGDGAFSAAIGKLDNDQNLDLAVSAYQESKASVLMNQAPNATGNPTTLAFGAWGIGETPSMSVNVDNDSGGDPLVVTEVYVDGESDFTVDAESCTAGPTPFNDFCGVQVDFTPSAVGARTANLVVEYAGAADSPLNIPLTGTGLDLTPPNTVIDSGPSGTITVDSAAFTFHGDPASDTAKIMCKLDSANYADCTSPKTYSGLANGPHTVNFRAQDAAGNQDQTPATGTFTVKTTVPPPPPAKVAKISKVTVKGPAKVKKGKKNTYTVKVINSGKATATGVKLKVSGKGVSLKKTIGQVAAGKTKSLKVKLKFKKPGKVKATFKVTSSNAGGKTARKTVQVRK